MVCCSGVGVINNGIRLYASPLDSTSVKSHCTDGALSSDEEGMQHRRKAGAVLVTPHLQDTWFHFQRAPGYREDSSAELSGKAAFGKASQDECLHVVAAEMRKTVLVIQATALLGWSMRTLSLAVFVAVCECTPVHLFIF